ncbi:MAG: exodeoxyribonuclease VII large subunit [Candidatus Omnitrophota bacterium]|nr:MAG: exodeoxyribonuclease VII large subunit [Candidatus Omnitrophota bacterium]
MKHFLKTEKTYTILELNTSVRRILKNEFPEAIWVCGEIQDLRSAKDKRHIYFSLVQKHPEADEIIAKASVAIFEGRKLRIFSRLQQEGSSLELKNDIEVRLKCEVDLYPKSGKFNLIVIDIDPLYTLGKFAQNRQRIIEDLRKQGLLEKNKLKDIPQVPLRLGLIAAYHSAAYHDFTSELTAGSYGFKVLLYNCHMQGEYVQRDVIKAFKFFRSLSWDALDVIVITRGGGPTADLSWFDNRKIAEAISGSQFPVLSALGHQINITITDLVSHTFFKTPTKVAQFLVERVRGFLDKLSTFQRAVLEAAGKLTLDKRKDLESLTLKIDAILPRYFLIHREELLERRHSMVHNLQAHFTKEKQKVLSSLKDMDVYLARLLESAHYRLQHCEEKVKLLDPKNVLKRGYSITLHNRRAVKEARYLEEGSILKTVLYKGQIISEVKGKEHDA